LTDTILWALSFAVLFYDDYNEIKQENETNAVCCKLSGRQADRKVNGGG
jgi:hypothetical protein